MKNKWRQYLLLAVILGVSVALRFFGIKWGLPNSLHAYSYHPDEFLTVGAAFIALTSFFPRFYNYPSLYIYLSAIAIYFAMLSGLMTNAADPYICARSMSAAMGVASVALTYWSATKLFSEDDHPSNIGMLAALILCIAPMHVQHSHFATVDVPSTLFIAACLGFSGLVLKRGAWRDYILCAVMAGLAAGTKYNAGLVIFSLIAAHFLGSKDRNAGFRRLISAMGCAIAAFIASTPGIIFRWSEFAHSFLYEVAHTSSGHGLVFAGTGNGFVYTFASSLWYGLGPALAILFAASAIYALCKLGKKSLTILAFVLPYYALISISQVRFARYSLPLFPAAAILIGWMACDIFRRIPKHIRWAWVAMLTVSLAGTLIYTIALDRQFVIPDPRDRAARWIFANIPKHSNIGMIDLPWFYSPPYSKTVGLGTVQQRSFAAKKMPYIQTPISNSINPLPKWCVITDYEALDALRLRNIESLSSDNAAQARRIQKDIAQIRQHYRLLKTFSNELTAFGICFGSTQSMPHDMRYQSPTIRIYEIKK